VRIDPADIGASNVYRLMVSAIVPRPIAWTGTRSADGADNLAPFSFFMGVGSSPPAIALSVVDKPDGAQKDTCRNILETEQFTVSIVPSEHAEAMVGTSTPLDAADSEFAAYGLTPVEGERVAAPRPAEARFSMECRLHDSMRVGTTTLLVGRVVLFHADDAVVVRGRRGNPQVDVGKLDPVARLGGRSYARVLEPFDLFAPERVDR